MLCEVGKKDMQLKRLFWTIIGAVRFFFAVFQEKNRAPEFRGSEKIIQLIRSVIIQGS